MGMRFALSTAKTAFKADDFYNFFVVGVFFYKGDFEYVIITRLYVTVRLVIVLYL